MPGKRRVDRGHEHCLYFAKGVEPPPLLIYSVDGLAVVGIHGIPDPRFKAAEAFNEANEGTGIEARIITHPVSVAIARALSSWLLAYICVA